VLKSLIVDFLIARLFLVDDGPIDWSQLPEVLGAVSEQDGIKILMLLHIYHELVPGGYLTLGSHS
jgi:hypothetical protein